MALQFKKAQRSAAKARIAFSGIAGSGKTASALLFSYGLVQAEHPDWTPEQCWSSICIIDTENASGSLYVNAKIGDTTIGSYNSINIEPPFTTDTGIEAIHLAEENGQEVIIADSMSAFWGGSGAALERQQQIAQRTGNSYTAWQPIKKEMKALMDAILQSKCHVVCCFRAKQEYVQEKNDRGKTVVRNVGLGVVYQEGAEYEVAVHFTLDQDHVAYGQKDRSGLYQGKFQTITPATGAAFAEWLKGDGSAPAPEKPKPQMKPATPAPQPEPEPEASEPLPEVTMEEVDAVIRAAVAAQGKEPVFERVKSIAGVKNYTKVTDPVILSKLYEAFKEE